MFGRLKFCSLTLPTTATILKAQPVVSLNILRNYWRITDKVVGDERNKCSRQPGKSIEVKNTFDSRHEMFKDGYGVTLYDWKDGERKNLDAVVARFKRLDWGAWIRPRAGRDKKRWKKAQTELVEMEKHVFCKPHHKRRFDRAVSMEIKDVRHIPDDPYKVYNDMSFQNYHSIKLKNKELIKKYGPKNFMFPHHVAHPRHNNAAKDKSQRDNDEPPGYHKDIHDGKGVYRPDPARPQDIMPPDYRLYERMESGHSKFDERKYWRKLRRYEVYSGPVSLCSPLRLPVVGTKLG